MTAIKVKYEPSTMVLAEDSWDFVCPHENTHTESVEVTYWPTPDIDASYNVNIEVCDQCDEQVGE